jgi:chromosome segregation ATPase
LRDKVGLYDELVESVKELVNRNARFMKNELEVCKLVNECAVMKRELEQKEKTIEDLTKDVGGNKGNEMVLESRIKERIDNKVENLRKIRGDLREKDHEIEFLEFIVKDKQSRILNLQSQNED